MGARRIDFIGFKFEVAQEIADGYGTPISRRAILPQAVSARRARRNYA